jgi:hypothetical protein
MGFEGPSSGVELDSTNWSVAMDIDDFLGRHGCAQIVQSIEDGALHLGIHHSI